MISDLQPTTETGRKFVDLAEKHARDFAERAETHDYAGTFPFDNFQDMKESGFLAGVVPVEYGGLGVSSLYDLMVGISRLGRGDASTAIAANMHICGTGNVVRFRHRAERAGDRNTVALVDELLRKVAKGEALMCFPNSEAGTDLTSPQTEATPVEGGYRVNGRKIFGTVSPAAQFIFPTVRLKQPDGGYVTATAIVERNTPGLEIKENWDSLGMRSSGSNDIVFSDCFVASHLLFGIRDNYGKAGQGFPDVALNVNAPLNATFLGIAEAARDIAVQATTKQKGPSRRMLGDRIPIQELIAQIEIDLSVARAMTDRLGRLGEAFRERYSHDDPPLHEANEIMKEVQCMKYVVTKKAVDVVDCAMTVCGGAAYMSKHPLSRLYRDARAGSFMQPYAPYEALEFIGKVALGIDATLDR
ncbi:acyl-CoA dehydrogenase family protein [Rhizobium rhizogenes]|uniref:acyl-CoA dehydrogenase family protein n=1 Tax=Rhizobium rhizogenes TaxID=359 RepID=UPI001574DEC5|nr:acyl-CoA dehydrogenase family protein [Rhizobium rhizogenes]NTG02969.1 acyl-CoA/acyl-ACP dehydrogenase [Rhizobium rhizogenes]NTG10032.1 acyl-CoA/acyl-ACP dehydrogenase [Rhizobium rhizogenes]